MKIFHKLITLIFISCLSLSAVADDWEDFLAIQDKFNKLNDTIPDTATYCVFAPIYRNIAQAVKPMYEERFEEALYANDFHRYRSFYKMYSKYYQHARLLCVDREIQYYDPKVLKLIEETASIDGSHTQMFDVISDAAKAYFKTLSNETYAKRQDMYDTLTSLQNAVFKSLRGEDSKENYCPINKRLTISGFILAQSDKNYLVESDKKFFQEYTNYFKPLRAISKSICNTGSATKTQKDAFMQARDNLIAKYPQSAEAHVRDYYETHGVRSNGSFSFVYGYTYKVPEGDDGKKKKKKKK